MEVEPTALATVGAAQGLWRYALKPFVDEHPGIIGWGVTLGVAGLYDAWAVSNQRQTMSNAFHEGVDHPILKFGCIGALGLLAVHLAHGVKDS